MSLLHLNLKGIYFYEVEAGVKLEEFRLYTPYWITRLEGREYEGILVKRGYPKRDDASRIIERPWRGFKVKTVQHSHFGSKPVRVFAIRVNG